MDPVLVTVAALAVVLLAALVAVVASSRARARSTSRELAAELAQSRAAVTELREQVQALSAVVDQGRPDASATDYVITSLPRDRPAEASTAALAVPADPVRIDARQFTTVAVGESVVRLVSLGHGVRRALSPANRNRIRFEMRREVKRARRQRRRDLKEAKRQLRSHLGDAA